MQVFGDASLLQKIGKRVAVIGPRKALFPYLEAAYEIGGFLSDIGFVVSSGLASGVDTAAMEGVMDREGLLTGFDYVPPSRQDPSREPQHSRIKKYCLSSGCLVYACPGIQGSEAPLRRNVVLVENVDAVISVTKGRTGTQHALRAARKRKLPVVIYQESVRGYDRVDDLWELLDWLKKLTPQAAPKTTASLITTPNPLGGPKKS